MTLQTGQGLDSVSGWYTGSRTTYTNDASGNNIGYVEQHLDTLGQWINNSQYTATYDSYNMITSSAILDWDTSGVWLPEYNRKWNYYYELYTVPTSVTEVSSVGDARIYPVPASGMVHVDINWSQAQESTITIYDMTGRGCGEWHLPASASYHGYVPVGSLAEGMYTMSVKGTSGTIQKTFNILR